MTHLFLLSSIGVLWLNLMGLGLLSRLLTKDYAVGRVAGLLGGCLILFFVEHFFGLGPKLPFLPFSSCLSGWLIWKYRDVLRENWGVEAMFAVGFFYCLAWRYSFPDLGLFAETIPDYKFVREYLLGSRLPADDLWFPPYKSNFYYSFQHYGAGLMGRWLWLKPGMTYHLAYCTLVGLMTCAAGAAAGSFCRWKPGRWVQMAAILIGGSGLCAAVHLFLRRPPALWESSRFLDLGRLDSDFTALGLKLNNYMYPPGHKVIELPVDSLGYVICIGEYHPPLAGYLLLAFAALLIAVLETGAEGRKRAICHGLLAASVPLVLISNTWVFPLQGLLVGGYFIYRTFCGEKAQWLPAVLGAALATGLAYPFLSDFTQQAAASSTALRLTPSDEHAPFLGWLLVFWPVVGSLILLQFHPENRSLKRFLTVFWIFLLFATEFVINDDIQGGTINRVNSTLKWWPWAYTGILFTVCAVNLGSRSRVARYGTTILLLTTCIYGYDLGRHFYLTGKQHRGHMEGTDWYVGAPFLGEMINTLSALPPGISIESGIEFENCEATILSLYAGKTSFLGWPVHESLWRGDTVELRTRLEKIRAFYKGEIDDPLTWLLQNNIRYILWFQRDNRDGNLYYSVLGEKIKSHYVWRRFFGDDKDVAIGFWERYDASTPVTR